MDRSLLAPRWLALHAVVLVAVVGCGLLGAWQLDRAREQRDESTRAVSRAGLAPVELDAVLPPGSSMLAADVGRPVEVTGRYDPDAQFVVPDRDLGGMVGSLVLTPLVTDDGSAVVVARGWHPGASPMALPTPPAGQVMVTGWLGASEGAPAPDVRPDGEVGSIHIPTLLNLVSYPLRDGFVALSNELPPAPADSGLTELPPSVPIANGGLPLQNVFYAAEWWIFGLAAVALWVSAVRRREITPIPAPADP